MTSTETRRRMLECLELISGTSDFFRSSIMKRAYAGFDNIIFSADNEFGTALPSVAQIKSLQNDGYRIEWFPPDAKPNESRRVVVSW